MTRALRSRAGRRPVALLALLLSAWNAAAFGADIDVVIEGVEGELADNVRAYLSIVRFREVVDLSPSNIRSMHTRADREIRRALRPFGYYSPEIRTSLEHAGSEWRASYRIDAGAPVRYGDVRLSIDGPGRDHPAFRAILGDPDLASGDVARHAPYERLKRRLRLAAYDNGFRDAELTDRELEIDIEQGTATVRLTLATGPQYRFGPVTYDQDILKESLIRRYPRFERGDPFSARTLLDLEYALTDSEYFSVVDVSAEPADGLDIPVLVTATPRKRQKYTVGLGFGTDTGPRVSLGWRNRRINRAGHRLAMDTKLSLTRQEISGRYIIPLEDPVRERLTVGLSVTQEELGDTDSLKNELNVAEIQMLGEWQRETYVRLLDETTTVDDVDSDELLLIPGVTYRRVRKDDAVFPRRASLLEGDVHGTHQSLGSGTSFIQLRIDTRLIRPVGDRHRLIVRASAGTNAIGDFDQLPASERFFAGGDQSIRGFALNELGPVDDDGQVIGGKHLLTASVEFEWAFNDRWAMAVFADGGNALDAFDDDLEAALGIGLRRKTQVGQIRLDIAQPVTESGASPRIHVSFGPEL